MLTNEIAIVGVEWDVVDLIESIPQYKLVGFIDFHSTQDFKDLPYLGKDEDWEEIVRQRPNLKVLLAMDRYVDRSRLSKFYGSAAQSTILSPFSYISPRSSIGVGTFVQRGATIMAQAKVGDYCKVNVNATVHHESQVGNYCTLAPGSQVLGRVVIEDGVYIGAGSVIRQNCRVGSGAIIGAGAVVVQDIPAGMTVVGVPAKEIKRKIN